MPTSDPEADPEAKEKKDSVTPTPGIKQANPLATFPADVQPTPNPQEDETQEIKDEDVQKILNLLSISIDEYSIENNNKIISLYPKGTTDPKDPTQKIAEISKIIQNDPNGGASTKLYQISFPIADHKQGLSDTQQNMLYNMLLNSPSPKSFKLGNMKEDDLKKIYTKIEKDLLDLKSKNSLSKEDSQKLEKIKELVNYLAKPDIVKSEANNSEEQVKINNLVKDKVKGITEKIEQLSSSTTPSTKPPRL